MACGGGAWWFFIRATVEYHIHSLTQIKLHYTEEQNPSILSPYSIHRRLINIFSVTLLPTPVFLSDHTLERPSFRLLRTPERGFSFLSPSLMMTTLVYTAGVIQSPQWDQNKCALFFFWSAVCNPNCLLLPAPTQLKHFLFHQRREKKS